MELKENRLRLTLKELIIYMIIRNLKKFYLHYGDLTDSGSLYKIINEIKPHEIYNLAAQSHVATSFDLPTYTSNVNALGTLRILETIRKLNLIKQNFTKLLHLNYLEKYNRKNNQKKLNFIL